MGGISNTFKKAVSNPLRTVADIGTFGTYELARKAIPGITRPFEHGVQSLTGQGQNPNDANPYIAGPFGLDPEQMARDKADILGLGDKQYADTLGAIDTNTAAQETRAKDLFQSMLPDIAENANAAHLYDSTGYGSAVADAQSEIVSKLTADAADKRLAALSGRQGFETGALQRGQSLEDFITQANVAKSIGAQMAPQMPNGKATGLSGGVAGAAAGAPLGPLGAGVGGALGLLLGSQSNKRSK